VQKELHHWEVADSVAQGWTYSVSHSQLLVRIYQQHGSGGPNPTSLWLYLQTCPEFPSITFGVMFAFELKSASASLVRSSFSMMATGYSCVAAFGLTRQCHQGSEI
jgi:hypothetical protein